MENNCFILKLKDSLQGNYDKLNFLKIKVQNEQALILSPDTTNDVTIKAEGCTFTQKRFNINDATEHTFRHINAYENLDFTIKGDGYLYVGNKYNIGRYQMYNADLNKIYSYNKAIKIIKIPFTTKFNVSVKGDINHLLSQCSPNLETLAFSSGVDTSYDVTGNIMEINKFTKLKSLSLNNKVFRGNISIFSSLINLTLLSLFDSNCTGSIEELVQAWYNNGKTTGTVLFYFNNTNITVPSIITNKDQFYCTFTEGGYLFSQTNPNT